MSADNLDILAAFERREDGSWHCLRAVRIETADGALDLRAGEVLRFGEVRGHLDVAEYLEQLGASFGS